MLFAVGLCCCFVVSGVVRVRVWFAVHCCGLLFVVRGVLVRWLLFVGRCRCLFSFCRLSFVAFDIRKVLLCLLFVVVLCVLRVVCSLLFVDCCSLRLVC